jgi:hypothetical protein
MVSRIWMRCLPVSLYPTDTSVHGLDELISPRDLKLAEGRAVMVPHLGSMGWHVVLYRTPSTLGTW